MSTFLYQSDGEFDVKLYLVDGNQFLLLKPVSLTSFDRVIKVLEARNLKSGGHPDYKCLIKAFPHLKNLAIVCPGDIDLPCKEKVGWYLYDAEGRPCGKWAQVKCPFGSEFYFLSVSK